MSCAVRDQTTSPGYRPPELDEEGMPIDAPPVPDYQVRHLACRFTGTDRNAALCRFDLMPNGSRTKQRVAVRFEHRFRARDGATSHLYGTLWSPVDRCTANAYLSAMRWRPEHMESERPVRR